MSHFDRTDLGQLLLLAEGGQGKVFDAPRARVNTSTDTVYKEYKPHVLPAVDFTQLASMVDFLADLSSVEGTKLIAHAAWPLALVSAGGQPAGFLMPKVSAEFSVNLTLPSGTKHALGQFQHLFNTESWLAQRGIQISDRLRLLLLHDVAETLAFLHAHDIVVGDLSAKNLLYTISSGKENCFFIDCDAMRLRGQSVLPQLETPDWDIRSISTEPLATQESDAYKLGLIALRLFATHDHQTTRNPTASRPITAELSRLIQQSLSSDPSRRPKPAEWLGPVGSAIPTASTKLPRTGQQPVAVITLVNPTLPLTAASPRTSLNPPRGGIPTPITSPTTPQAPSTFTQQLTRRGALLAGAALAGAAGFGLRSLVTNLGNPNTQDQGLPPPVAGTPQSSITESPTLEPLQTSAPKPSQSPMAEAPTPQPPTQITAPTSHTFSGVPSWTNAAADAYFAAGFADPTPTVAVRLESLWQISYITAKFVIGNALLTHKPPGAENLYNVDPVTANAFTDAIIHTYDTSAYQFSAEHQRLADLWDVPYYDAKFLIGVRLIAGQPVE